VKTDDGARFCAALLLDGIPDFPGDMRLCGMTKEAAD
jgi:hypothetical protein